MGWRGLAAAGLLFATAGAAKAADSPYDPRGGRDQQIVTQLHQRNQDLIATARIADRRASRADVKDYADRVIEQREFADAQLLTYAQQEGMNMDAVQAGAGALPHGPGSLASAQLNNVSASRFDAFFAAEMNAREQAAADEAVHAQKLALGQQLAGLIGDQMPVMRQEQASAANLTSVLPLPAPSLQQPGEVEVVSWTLPGAPR